MLILVPWFNSSGLRKVKYYWLYYCEFLSVLQPCKNLLPAVRHQDMHKKCVVIDLDETLVHSSFKVQSWLFDKVMIVVVNVKKAINIHDPGAWAPFILRPNWGTKGQKFFFGDCPPPPPSFTLGSGWPPTPLSQGLDLALKFSKLILKHFLEELVERIWWKIKAFPFGDLFFILITFLLEDVLMLLGENWCWSLLGLNGLLNP